MMQYATDVNLAARQRLWAISPSEPELRFHDWFLALADIRPGNAVAEIGCGNGVYLARIDAIGMDLSPGMLASARERARGPLVCGDAQQIPFADGAFDVVLAPHMLYHVPDREAAARELRRITRRGGRCVAATNGDDNHAEMVRLVEDVVGSGWRWQRSAMSSFSLENGGEQLRAGFEHVERVDTPSRVVHVTDADAFADYLASVADLYQPQITVPWADVVAECRRRCAAVIERDGAFRITAHTGAFVCR